MINERRKEGKGNVKFRSIKWLPIMWKVFAGILAEQVYGHMEREKLLSDKQKGCRRHIRGTKDQLMIDKMLIKNCKGIMTNLSVAWIDYKKAH